MKLAVLARYAVVSALITALSIKPGVTEDAKPVLKLSMVMTSTVRHHPMIQAQVQRQLAADASLLSTKGAFDPKIRSETLTRPESGYSGTYTSTVVEQPIQMFGGKVFAGHRMGRGSFPVYEDYYNTNQDGEIGVGIEIPLLRDRAIDRRRADIAKARYGQTQAGANVALSRIEVTKSAALAYWRWVFAANKVRVYQDLLAVAEKRNRQISVRVKRGDLPDFDRVDNDRAVEQRRATMLSAKRELQSASYQLALFYRDENGEPIDTAGFLAPDNIAPLKTNLDSLSLDDALAEALGKRPEFEYLTAQQAQNDVEITLANNQINPRLDVKLFGSDDIGPPRSKGAEAELKAAIQVEIPLATRTQRGKRRRFQSEQNKIRLDKQFLREKIRVDIQDAMMALRITKQTVDVVTREVSAAQTVAKGERTRFELGDSNLIFVNLREQNAADAEVRRLAALFEVQKAEIFFRAVLGRAQGDL
jgi:cobalt-zinc-cadmium efflux system outer membrane protein